MGGLVVGVAKHKPATPCFKEKVPGSMMVLLSQVRSPFKDSASAGTRSSVYSSHVTRPDFKKSCKKNGQKVKQVFKKKKQKYF